MLLRDVIKYLTEMRKRFLFENARYPDIYTQGQKKEELFGSACQLKKYLINLSLTPGIT